MVGVNIANNKVVKELGSYTNALNSTKILVMKFADKALSLAMRSTACSSSAFRHPFQM